MKFTLEITTGNDAMQTYNDIRESIAAALHPTRRSRNSLLQNGRLSAGDGGKLMDENGNSVGKWEVID